MELHLFCRFFVAMAFFVGTEPTEFIDFKSVGLGILVYLCISLYIHRSTSVSLLHSGKTC